jgi:hypothetical protein
MLNTKKSFLKTLLIFVLHTTMASMFGKSVSAQEMWGISNSNFSGHMGLFLNPSHIVGAPYQYEINVAALDQFAENTFLYLPLDEKIIYLPFSDEVRKRNNFYTNSNGFQNGFSHELIIGPGYIRNKNNFAWGIHSAFRSGLSVTGISPELALLRYENFNTEVLNDTMYSTSFTSAYTSWYEVGGSYGKVFRENEMNLFKYGVNVNLLIGQGGYFYKEDGMDFTSLDSSQIVLHRMNTTYGHTATNSNKSVFGLRGLGLGTTVGVTYIKEPNRGAFDCNMSNDRQRKYKYRIGFSLIDLGMIRYFDDATESNVSIQSNYTLSGVDSFSVNSFQDLDTVLLNAGGTIEEKDFSIWLPLALSVQFDYQLRPNLFANASVVNRIHFFENQVARGNQAAVSVRYERRRLEGNINFSLFEWNKPAMGVGLRYRFLVIGTDRLLELAGISDSPSYNIYFGLKFQFCKKPFSKGPDCPSYLSN